MKKKSELEWDSYILHIYQSEFDDIRTYFDKLEEAIAQENFEVRNTADQLKRKGVPEEDIVDFLDEDDYFANIFENNTYNMALVFLYTECEKTMKYQYRVIGDRKTKSMFKWENTISLFKEKGIDIKTNSHFKKLNEIRIINNCIKHDGYPDDELCKMDSIRWKHTEKIKITKTELDTFYDEAKLFFDELVIEIENVNKKSLLEEEIKEVINLCNKNLSSVSHEQQKLITDAISKLQSL